MIEKNFIYSLNDINYVVNFLYELMSKFKIFTFTGILGAGKTTLIKELLKKSDVKSLITSPTFTYVNKYENAKGQIFYHFDLYKMWSVEEFLSLGFEELFYEPNSWSFIEWPELIIPLISQKFCNIFIEYKDEYTRELIYKI